MRYLVLGCGAIGGTAAAGLARDGHDVLVGDADLLRAAAAAQFLLGPPPEARPAL